MELQNNDTTLPNQARSEVYDHLRILRWTLSALCMGLIVWRLRDADLERFLSVLSTTSPIRLLALVTAIAFVGANLGLEAARWRLCLAGLEVRGWRSHFAAVLAGISIGMPLSHLVGDFSGKLALARRHASDAVPLLMAASFAQYWVSFFGGMVAVWLLLRQGLLPEAAQMLGNGLAGWVVFLLIAYLSLPRVYRLARTLPFAWAEKLPATVVWPSLPNLLSLSILRYGVILAQYALLVSFFAPTSHLILFIAGTAVALGIKTLVPFLSIGGMLGLRELLALTVLGSLGFDDALVIAVSLAVWLLNVAMPALAGAAVLARIRSGAWWEL